MLARLLNGFMNSKEIKTGKVFKQWDQAIDIIRTDLNEIRKRPDGNPQFDIFEPPLDVKPKFKVGDVVYYRSERPMDALGKISTY